MTADDTRDSTRIAHLRSTVLDEAREALGLTWGEVAEAAGITPQALRNIRSGTSLARMSTLRSLETALQLPAGALSGRTLLGTTEERERRMQVALLRAQDRERNLRATAVNGGHFLLIEVKATSASAEQINHWARLLQRFADALVEEETKN